MKHINLMSVLFYNGESHSWKDTLHIETKPWSARSQIAKFMGPTWDPPRSYQPQMGPMLAPWTLLSGVVSILSFCHCRIFTVITWDLYTHIGLYIWLPVFRLSAKGTCTSWGTLFLFHRIASLVGTWHHWSNNNCLLHWWRSRCLLFPKTLGMPIVLHLMVMLKFVK